jgi:hypothetical protein
MGIFLSPGQQLRHQLLSCVQYAELIYNTGVQLSGKLPVFSPENRNTHFSKTVYSVQDTMTMNRAQKLSPNNKLFHYFYGI